MALYTEKQWKCWEIEPMYNKEKNYLKYTSKSKSMLQKIFNNN